MPAAGRSDGSFGVPLARAFAGALIFSLPLLMTMEMWSLAVTMDPLRLALFLAVNFCLLVVMAYYSGFEEAYGLRDLVLAACVAYAVAFGASAAGLYLLGLFDAQASLREVVSMIALQTVPAGIGAMLARSQLGEQNEEKEERRRRDSYGGEIAMAALGAVFMAFNVAPTEEIVLISTRLSAWQALLLMVVSLALMHAFVYAVEFRGQSVIAPGLSAFGEFVRLTVVAYVLALAISLYVLWTFGRSDDLAMGELLIRTVVLGFPAAIGAAAARLIL